MLFMMVERFEPGALHEVYRIVQERGRLLPEGLSYVDFRVWAGLDVCFQFMECDDPALIQEWAASWGDLARMEVVPVVPLKTTAALFARLAGAESTTS